MLVDDVVVRLTAGHGGRGAVAFQRVKFSLGPTGADGGKGGSVYFEGVANLDALAQFRYKKEVQAKNGQNGKRQFNDGHDGDDEILQVPVGTVIHNEDLGTTVEITQIGQRELAVRGGMGGRGNFKFRSSTNTSPKEFEEGKPGQSYTFHLELKLIADVGLIGLPNVGKSSLLNALTGASSKVANYPFTTLEPSLGVYYEVILADIPGLIEGAASGKGLGHKFLRHVERTRELFHLVAADSETVVRDYQTVRAELAAHDPALPEKRERVFLSRADEVAEEVLAEKIAELAAAGVSAEPISILDENGLGPVIVALREVAQEKQVK